MGEDAEIQTANAHELFDVLDADMSGQLTIVELVNGLMRLRGPITKSEMVAVRMKIRHITQEVRHIVSRVCPKTEDEERGAHQHVVAVDGLQNRLSRMSSKSAQASEG